MIKTTTTTTTTRVATSYTLRSFSTTSACWLGEGNPQKEEIERDNNSAASDSTGRNEEAKQNEEMWGENRSSTLRIKMWKIIKNMGKSTSMPKDEVGKNVDHNPRPEGSTNIDSNQQIHELCDGDRRKLENYFYKASQRLEKAHNHEMQEEIKSGISENRESQLKGQQNNFMTFLRQQRKEIIASDDRYKDMRDATPAYFPQDTSDITSDDYPDIGDFLDD